MSTFKFSKLRDCAIAPSPKQRLNSLYGEFAAPNKNLIAPDPAIYDKVMDEAETSLVNEVRFLRLRHQLDSLCFFIRNNFADCDEESVDYATYFLDVILDVLEEAVK